MDSKSQILEKYIHPTKFLSSLSTETGKLAIFQAMSEYGRAVVSLFLKWADDYAVLIEGGVWIVTRDEDGVKYTEEQLFDYFITKINP